MDYSTPADVGETTRTDEVPRENPDNSRRRNGGIAEEMAANAAETAGRERNEDSDSDSSCRRQRTFPKQTEMAHSKTLA